MKVLYDHQIFQEQVFGGISKSFCEIIRRLPPEVEWELSIRQSDNIHLKSIAPEGSVSPIQNSYKRIRSRWKWAPYVYTLADRLRFFRMAESLNKEASVKALKRGDSQVFHPTYFGTYFLDYIGKKPFVLTVHDLTSERFPAYFGPNDHQIVGRKALVSKAAAIVTVSESTKRDLMELYGVSEDKITVIYHGGPAPVETISTTLSEPPYFMFVGMRGRYKNFSALLKGFSAFSSKFSEVRLLCVGKPFTKSEEDAIRNSGVATDRVSVISSVDDEQLNRLYQSAIALVYPSKYEGFGMPILEAFANNCPVLTGCNTSLPEVGGEAALYLAEDDSDMSEKLEELYLLSTEDRLRLIGKGRERLSCFSWEKAASQYAALYQSLV